MRHLNFNFLSLNWMFGGKKQLDASCFWRQCKCVKRTMSPKSDGIRFAVRVSICPQINIQIHVRFGFKDIGLLIACVDATVLRNQQQLRTIILRYQQKQGEHVARKTRLKQSYPECQIGTLSQEFLSCLFTARWWRWHYTHGLCSFYWSFRAALQAPWNIFTAHNHKITRIIIMQLLSPKMVAVSGGLRDIHDWVKRWVPSGDNSCSQLGYAALVQLIASLCRGVIKRSNHMWAEMVNRTIIGKTLDRGCSKHDLATPHVLCGKRSPPRTFSQRGKNQRLIFQTLSTKTQWYHFECTQQKSCSLHWYFPHPGQ